MILILASLIRSTLTNIEMRTVGVKLVVGHHCLFKRPLKGLLKTFKRTLRGL